MPSIISNVVIMIILYKYFFKYKNVKTQKINIDILNTANISELYFTAGWDVYINNCFTITNDCEKRGRMDKFIVVAIKSRQTPLSMTHDHIPLYDFNFSRFTDVAGKTHFGKHQIRPPTTEMTVN